MAILAVSLIGGIAAGCSIGVPTQQENADRMGMTASVTYYANGGEFSDNKICYKTMYFVPGTPIFDINTDRPPIEGKPLSISRENYTFGGWVKAELDANGLPILLEMVMDEKSQDYIITDTVLPYKENGTADILDTDGKQKGEQPKTFTAKIPDNMEFAFENGRPMLEDKEHLFLVAYWLPDVKLDYVLVLDDEDPEATVTFKVQNVDDPETEDVDESETYSDVEFKTGDVIARKDFGLTGRVTLNGTTEPATPVSDHSYIYLYWDEECTKPVNSENGYTVDRPDDGVNAKIYAKYLPGKWTPVSTYQNVARMFTTLGDNNYYIVDNIDCTASSLSLGARAFSGIIEGNGYTLSNLTFTNSQNLDNGAKVSIFGEIAESAVIRDLTIENVKATVTVGFNATVNIFALFLDCAESATITNFSVENYELNITRRSSGVSGNSVIDNIQQMNDGSYAIDYWIYGGYTKDEFFTAEHGSIVKNATLIINEETIAGGQQ